MSEHPEQSEPSEPSEPSGLSEQTEPPLDAPGPTGPRHLLPPPGAVAETVAETVTETAAGTGTQAAASGGVTGGQPVPGVKRTILRPAIPVGQVSAPVQAVKVITTHPLAKASLVLGLLGILHWGFGVAALVAGFVALLLIHRRSRAAEDPMTRPGRGQATAGIVLGGVFSLLVATGVMAKLGDALLPGSEPKQRTVRTSGLLTYGELAQGQCYDDDNTDDNTDQVVSARSCTEPHRYEVISRVTPTATTWPGLEALDKEVDEVCAHKFDVLLDPDVAESIEGLVIRPLDASAFRFDPDFLCIARDPGGTISTSVHR